MALFIQDKKQWNSWLSCMDNYDFYHTYEYHHILKNDDETPVLIIFEKGDIKIGIPFLKRKINSEYYDLVSVHGYLGPISCNIPANFDNTDFMAEFNDLLTKEKIVSVFSKLNPFIEDQEKILNSTSSKINTIGEIVYFDQQKDDESQLKDYNRNTKQKIKQLKKICSVDLVSNNDDNYHEFISLYHKGMKRLNAKSLFYFDDNYFSSLLNSDMLNAKMLIASHNETKEIMAGVFCVCTNDIAHIELAFTNEEYFKFSPVRVLFEASRKLYKNNEIKYLNLGGGKGGKEGSLMKFKSGFTKNYRQTKAWKHIVLNDVYDNLMSEEQKNTESSFFPKYRILNLTN